MCRVSASARSERSDRPDELFRASDRTSKSWRSLTDAQRDSHNRCVVYWVNALTISLFAAALALIGNIAFAILRQCRERRSIAAALAGEIGACMTLLNPPAAADNFRELAALDHATRCMRLKALPEAIEAHTVFDKVAGKIALLPAAEALEVSAIYTVFTGMRTILGKLSGVQFAETDDTMQIMTLKHVASMLDQRQESAQELIRRLHRIADESPWQFLRSITGRPK